MRLTNVFSTVLLFMIFVIITPNVMAETIKISLWSRHDNSGPMRTTNIIEASKQLNKKLKDSGDKRQVVVKVIAKHVRGYDIDAERVLERHKKGHTPDIIVAGHEWLGKFKKEGLIVDLESHILTNPDYYYDIIPILWDAVMVEGKRYGIPQDWEVRMFFLNNEMMRAAGISDTFIESLPRKVDSGEFTMYDLCDLAARIKKKDPEKIGILHRPNFGPEFQMAMASFGNTFYNQELDKLVVSRSKLLTYYKWLHSCVKSEAIPAKMTRYSWRKFNAAFIAGSAFAKFHGIWNLDDQLEYLGIDREDKDSYNKRVTWINAPAGIKGGRSTNLSHPIVYTVGNTGNKETTKLAKELIALASQPGLNNNHAISSTHLPINHGQWSTIETMDSGWGLLEAKRLLKDTNLIFMPNHSSIGEYNRITFENGVMEIELNNKTPKDAMEEVIDELQKQLNDDVMVVD